MFSKAKQKQNNKMIEKKHYYEIGWNQNVFP